MIRPVVYHGIWVDLKCWSTRPNWMLFKAYISDTGICILIIAAFVLMLLGLDKMMPR